MAASCKWVRFDLNCLSPLLTLNPATEYALKAVELENITAVALRSGSCAVVATQKENIDKYAVPRSTSNLFTFNKTIGCCMVGRMGDALHQMKLAQHIAYLFSCDCDYQIPVDVLCHRVANLSQVHTQNSLMRVLGCCMILISYDDETGPTVYKTDPSANCSGFKACAVGTHSVKATKYLEQKYRRDLSQDKAIQLAINCLLHVRSNDSEEATIEVGVVSKCDPNFRILSDREIEEFLSNDD
ncbi:proteasome subunit alpha type-6-like isoform X2 [Drosophila serrata]|uniref:proteasome subunit alpha type-6-like isoform X2 n=1 Tax=Drosophila serrata TaxID=7274 RepID=UPI000A1D0F22|nr:proteasome subunit alpha type-6-like isoform X2 [Drosophila serrata]